MKVWPKNDAMRKMLKHGVVAFPEEGPADWPDDTFTHRRIMDGDVTTEEPKKVSSGVTQTPHLRMEAAAAASREEEKKTKPDVGKA